MTRSSADGLRRLRWLLTMLLTATNTVGLVLFSWALLSLDAARGEEQLDAELRRVTSSVLRLIHYQGGTIDFAEVSEDDLNDQCPEFVILSGGNRSFQGRSSRKDCVQVGLATLSGLARESAASGRLLTGYVRGLDGGLVRVSVEPFLDVADGQYAGAVVAAGDADDEQQRHQRVVLRVLVGCLVLIGSVAALGYVLSGRAIRPAAAALEQHEVLLAETAHDLRTPVAALRALAETAVHDPQQRAELLPRTVRLAVRMGDIIDGLLVRARLAAGAEQLAIQPVWLDQLVSGVVEEVLADEATVTLIAAPTQVEADPALLQRAIANLIDNALRHGRTPGTKAVVTVTVANGRVTVADRGPGVDAELSGDLFERFSGTGSSSGLGLSIVRWVALAHGGSLSVFNAEEGGAIFELALPATGP